MDDSLNESSVSAISRDSGLSTSIADDTAHSECSESDSDTKPHVFESGDVSTFQEHDSFIHVNDVDNLSMDNHMKPSVVQELFPPTKENVKECDRLHEAEEDYQETVRFRFLVLYLGVTTLDRRYQPSDTVMPWLMSEVKRQQEFQEITIEVLTNTLRAISCNENGTETVFEHGLKGIFKFSKTHQDPRCFGYLTRQKLGSDFDCHVFLTHEEKTVKEIFSCIRDATREAAKDPSDLDEMGESKDTAFTSYEVMYVGKVKVSSKKITSDYLDDLVSRLQEKEMSHFKQQHQEDTKQRSRHASGASVKSLPGNLETSVSVTENELGKRQHGADADSNGSSLDDLGSAETLESSSECLMGNLNLAKDSDSSEDLYNVNSTNNNCHFKSAVAHKTPWKENSRAMLFRLGKNEISLISLDKKQIILERQFKDISFVSQGNNKQDIFAFIARDEKNIFLCHILRCHCGSLVDEVMTSLRMAFNAAFQQNRQTTHQVCSDCPLQQFQRLCQDIAGLTSQSAHEVIKQKLQKLSEKDMSEISMKLKIYNPQSYDEIVEVLMIALRRLCEAKQCEHLHMSDTNRLSRPEFHLMDLKGRASAFDSFRNKAKKSLTNSFENLLLRGRKRDEAREAFRQRSGTNDSEGSWAGRSLDSSATNTPDCSPLPSPVTKEFRCQLPTPPRSPEAGRPRSSTLGALSGVTKKSPKQEKQQSDVHANSPMKQMFLMVGSSGSGSKVGGSAMSPSHWHTEVTQPATPRHSNSWRQAIFNSVVTPVRPSSASHKGEDAVDGVHKTKLSPLELRTFWKKAIMETLLLIRMEKENQSLRARQDEVDTKRKKLDYQEITPCLKDVTKTWDAMLQSESRESMCFDPKVLLSAVKQGVPRSKRGDIWRLLVEQHKVKGDEPDAAEASYEDLLKQLTTHQHAILIDLGRTFPGHPYFSTQLGPGQLSLFNILKAYSLLDNEVGYCQGLSFVAGILLMHMEEADAFEMIRYLMFGMGLRKRYLPNMMALQIHLYQLTRLLYDHYQDLHNHLDAYEIAPTLYAAPWFLTLFASQFPLGFVARVFDLILQQGPDVVFKVAIVLLGNHKELIMQCDSFESIVEFLKTTLPEMGIIQMERIINQAFQLDISSQLQAYEVEYHVLKEEMLFSTKPHVDSELTLTNRALQQQNVEIISELQQAHSQLRSQEGMIHKLQESEGKLKSAIQTLEIERNALLNALSKSQSLLNEDDLENSNLDLPTSLSVFPSTQSTTVQQRKGQKQGVPSNSESSKQDASVANNNSHSMRDNYNRKS